MPCSRSSSATCPRVRCPRGQCPGDRVKRPGGGRLVESVSGAQLLTGDPPYPRSGQVEQPADVLGPHEVPRRSQHMGPQDRAVIQHPRQVSVIRVRGARGHGPPRLTRVLGLHRQQRADHLACRQGMRPDQVLAAQPPPGNIHVPHHTATSRTEPEQTSGGADIRAARAAILGRDSPARSAPGWPSARPPRALVRPAWAPRAG